MTEAGSSGREIVVVTGASSGIGAATARELAGRGFHVLAGVRRKEDADALRAIRLEPITLDITCASGIDALARRVADDPERRPLRALVNNAGIAMNTPVETLPLAAWRDLFEVNFFGHVAMTQALLPALIASRGIVVNTSSVGGRVAMATYGPYAATKFALEAVSDALRREVAPLGVRVVVVEPGAVKTRIMGRNMAAAERFVRDMSDEQRGRYASLMHAVLAQAEAHMRKASPAEAAARVIADAIASKHPRARLTIGRDAAVLVRLIRLLSDRALDSLLAYDLQTYLRKVPAS